ncbi:MAG TPA: ABC transporter permease [archaeon]|nr:ABC transporter permease [archaeon]
MIKLAFLNLFRHRARTFLSLAAIVIGVMSIIAMVSVVDGIFFEVNEAIGRVAGIRVLQKDIGPPFFSSINDSWAVEAEKINGVKHAVQGIFALARTVEGKDVSAGGFGANNITGVDLTKNLDVFKVGVSGELVEGRNLKSGDSGVVIIGQGIKDTYNKFLGNSIKVNGKKMKIIGVYETGAGLLNNNFIMSIEDAREITSFPLGKISGVLVVPQNPDDVQKIVDVFNFKFSEDEVEAVSASDLSSQFTGFIDNFRLVVFIVAAVAAVVAGIGILNTMLMSVLERFKEIGALKAVGWAKFDIVKMILFESIFIGVLGGLLGIIFGLGGAAALEIFFGLNTEVTLQLLFNSFMFSVLIGLIAGFYPAWVASKMDPIEALRAE